MFDKLQAVHSSAKMINHVRATGGLVRKDPVATVHPLVRIHPITREKCLFVNGEFITRIVGLKDTETKLLLDFVSQHFIAGHDFQVRVRWSPRTIVIFDNRNTIRGCSFGVEPRPGTDCLDTAVVDYIDEDHGAKPRHIFRLCAMAEKPVPVHDFGVKGVVNGSKENLF